MSGLKRQFYRAHQLTSGFTLLEVLIAITLLAMIMVMLYAGLRSSSRAVTRAEIRVDVVNKIRVAHEFVRTQLRSMLLLTIEEEAGEDPIRFEGDKHRMRFVAPMPGYLGSGGPYVQTLELSDTPDNGNMALLFHHQSLHTLKTKWEAVEPAEPVLLLEGIKQGAFSYLSWNEESEIREWEDDWESVSEIPLLIKIELELDTVKQFPWPPLIVAPMVDQSRRNKISKI